MKEISILSDFPREDGILQAFLAAKKGFTQKEIGPRHLFTSKVGKVDDTYILQALEDGFHVCANTTSQDVWLVGRDGEKLNAYVKGLGKEAQHESSYEETEARGPRLSSADELDVIRKRGLCVGRKPMRSNCPDFLPMTADLATFEHGHSKDFMVKGILQSALFSGCEIPETKTAEQVVDLIVSEVQKGNRGTITLVQDEDGFVSIEGQENRQNLAAKLISVLGSRQKQLTV